MIYALSVLFLLAPLLFTLLLVADIPMRTKLWLGLAGLALITAIPIAVFLASSAGSLSG